MLRIKKAQANTIAVTLREAPDGTGPNYLVKFTSSELGVTRSTDITDVSGYPTRFQKFTITETDNPTLAGEVSLSTGEWLYEFWSVDGDGDPVELLEQAAVIVYL
jgi:hypothetical protein